MMECCTNAFSPPCCLLGVTVGDILPVCCHRKGITRGVRAEICVLARSLYFLTTPTCETSISHSGCFLTYVLNTGTLQSCVAKLYFSFSYAKEKKNNKTPKNHQPTLISAVYVWASCFSASFMPAADHKGYGGFCWRTVTEAQAAGVCFT